MPLPPAFADRTAAEQIIGAVVVTTFFGLVTGFALGWNEIAEAYLGEPQAGLVFVTTIAGAILGALGGAYRARREQAQPA